MLPCSLNSLVGELIVSSPTGCAGLNGAPGSRDAAATGLCHESFTARN